ncbi:hypothetical protein FIN92_02355 [Prevotella brunnea]|nr:hypothetical protein [Prevotella brunnea]
MATIHIKPAIIQIDTITMVPVSIVGFHYLVLVCKWETNSCKNIPHISPLMHLNIGEGTVFWKEKSLLINMAKNFKLCGIVRENRWRYLKFKEPFLRILLLDHTIFTAIHCFRKSSCQYSEKMLIFIVIIHGIVNGGRKVPTLLEALLAMVDITTQISGYQKTFAIYNIPYCLDSL